MAGNSVFQQEQHTTCSRNQMFFSLLITKLNETSKIGLTNLLRTYLLPLRFQTPSTRTLSPVVFKDAADSLILFKEEGWTWSWWTTGCFRLKACSAAVISHHPVPSGCFRLAWECSYNSGLWLMSPSPALKACEAPESTEKEGWKALYTL